MPSLSTSHVFRFALILGIVSAAYFALVSFYFLPSFLIIAPGFIIDLLLSGNIHNGSPKPWNYIVGTIGSTIIWFLIFTFLVPHVKWLFTKEQKKET